MWQEAVMGRPLITVATKLLADGAQAYFPAKNGSINPVQQFTMIPPEYERTGYLLFNRDMGYQVELHLEQLEDPSFDLIGWYMQ